ncbi:MAG: hypothetical protein MJ172_06700 [Clostridia bacterium]|nr:hypothetical protein [Clostridia bacterium]
MRFTEGEKDVFYRMYNVRDDVSELKTKLKRLRPERFSSSIVVFLTVIIFMLYVFNNKIQSQYVPLAYFIVMITSGICIMLVQELYYSEPKTKLLYSFGIVATLLWGGFSMMVYFSLINGKINLVESAGWLFWVTLAASILTVVGSFIFSFLYNKSCSETVTGVVKGYVDAVGKSGRYSPYFAKTALVCEFEFEGSKYLVTDYKFVRNDQDLPYIGSSVEIDFNPDDPDTCIIEGKKAKPKLGIGIGFFLLMFAVLVFNYRTKIDGKVSDDNRILLNSDYIHGLFGSDEKYYVIEREIIAIENGYIYFDDYAGAPRYVNDNSGKLEAGDVVYYVCTASLHQAVFPVDKYSCEDNGNLKLHIDYTEDGKFVLDDYMVSRSLNDDYWNIYKTHIVEIQNDLMHLMTDDGMEFWMEWDEGYRYISKDYQVGDEFYYVLAYTNKSLVFDTDIYYRKNLENTN